MSRGKPFWTTKSLSQMNRREWESLCDGCGRCCLNKFEEEGTKKIFFTNVACKLLDLDTCRCSDYKNRQAKVPDCISLKPDILPEMNCLPPTCAYRLLHEGKELPNWHPLITGTPESVHEAGISVRGRAISERGLTARQIARRIVKWPKSRRVRRPKVKTKP